MNEKIKIGRNDPCFCGSGKKYKQCCFLRGEKVKKIKATWLKPSQKVHLIEDIFSHALPSKEETFKPIE